MKKENVNDIFEHVLNKLNTQAIGLLDIQVKQAVQNLSKDLNTAKELFLKDNNINQLQYNCKTAISCAEKICNHHKCWWYSLNPMLRTFLGVLSAVTIIPGIIVQAASRHGYCTTFFHKPPNAVTRTLKNNVTPLLQYFFKLRCVPTVNSIPQASILNLNCVWH